MKYVEVFNRFLVDEVNLNPVRRRELDRRTRAVTTFLSRSLDGYRSNERQGSYALGTIIRPVNDGEYDADILVFMQNVKCKRARDYIDDLYTCLRDYHDIADNLRQKTRCVSVKYPGDFSLDMVPCIRRGERLYVCNSEDNRLEPTDGTGYLEWFNVKTEVTNGHLKGTVRLLKYIRDHKGNFEVPSVLLTTLAGHSVQVNERGKRFTNLPETLQIVSKRMNAFLQAVPRRPRLRNPALRGERFNRHWDNNDYRNFREKFQAYYDWINDACAETDPQASLHKWQGLFGDGFR